MSLDGLFHGCLGDGTLGLKHGDSQIVVSVVSDKITFSAAFICGNESPYQSSVWSALVFRMR